MNPQHASNSSIRFLNLYLLFRNRMLVEPQARPMIVMSILRQSQSHRFATTVVLELDADRWIVARTETKASLFSSASVRGPGLVVHLLIEHRPVLAEKVSACSRRQIQPIAKEGISDGAISIWPIDVRQSFRHERPTQA